MLKPNEEVKVSVICLVYNHEPFLEKCLESIVKQTTNYRFELIIHDDASTDKSADIIRSYAKAYPEIIRPIYQAENQYSRGTSIGKEYIFPLVRGKYVAFCEGDDFWLDKYKIQKQVEYMENHIGCTFCFSNAEIVNTNNEYLYDFYRGIRKWKKDKDIQKKLNDRSGADFSTEEMLRLDFTPTAAGLMTYDAFSKVITQYGTMYDLTIRIVATDEGYAHYFRDKMTAYRTGNPNSAAGQASKTVEHLIKNFYLRQLRFYEEFDIFTQYKYNETIMLMKERKAYRVYYYWYLSGGIRELESKLTRREKIATKYIYVKNYLKKAMPFLVSIKRMIHKRKTR